MAARAIWKGFLKLSLVSVPVKAYTATHSPAGELRFNRLHAGCNSRIKNDKVCPIHGEVKNEEIVSGFEYAKDQYVIVDLAELDKLRTPDDKAVTIREFVARDAIDAVYFSGSTHYLLPDGPVGQKAYAVLFQAMLEESQYAVGEVVWHGKERIVLIRPKGGLLAMSALSFDAEITKPVEFADEVPVVEIAPAEMSLAKMLIGAASPEQFDFSKYKDTYTQKVMQLIEAKIAGKEIVAAQTHGQTQIIDLMEALQKSVAQITPAPAEAKPTLKIAEQTEQPEVVAAPDTPAPDVVDKPGPLVAPSKKGKSKATKKKKSS